MTETEDAIEERVRPLILLADDDNGFRGMLRSFLGDRDVDIVEASNGADALELVLTEGPDLVILDVMMPELNGWEVCRYIKGKPELAETGVILFTGIGARVNEMTSPLYGADAALNKDGALDLDALDGHVGTLLARAGWPWSRSVD